MTGYEDAVKSLRVLHLPGADTVMLTNADGVVAISQKGKKNPGQILVLHRGNLCIGLTRAIGLHQFMSS